MVMSILIRCVTRNSYKSNNRLFSSLQRPNPHLHRADMVASAVFSSADVRVSAVRCSRLTEEAARRWGWSLMDIKTNMWGSHAAFSLMCSSFMRGEERVKANLEFDSSKETGVLEDAYRHNLFVETVALGEVRGYVHTSPASPAKPTTLTIDRILYDIGGGAHSSTIPSCGDIRLDWQRFYDTSEQVATFCCVESKCDSSDDVFIGGLTIQALPPTNAGRSVDRNSSINDEFKGANAVAAIRKLWEKGGCPSMMNMFEEGRDGLKTYLETLAKIDFSNQNATADVSNSSSSVLGKMTSLTFGPLDFYCRCTKNGFLDKLSVFPVNELKEMKKQTKCELTCQFCNETYTVDKSELEYIIKNAKK